jgi:hypothetical protein
MKYRIVETDNFDRGYPAESFCGPVLEEEDAKRVAALFNEAAHAGCDRFWKVEPVGYKLKPGFEP